LKKSAVVDSPKIIDGSKNLLDNLSSGEKEKQFSQSTVEALPKSEEKHSKLEYRNRTV